jgi:hypothetical protein
MIKNGRPQGYMNTGAEGTTGRPVDCNPARKGSLSQRQTITCSVGQSRSELRARLAPRWQHESIGLA